jgi:hypothetical protein
VFGVGTNATSAGPTLAAAPAPRLLRQVPTSAHRTPLKGLHCQGSKLVNGGVRPRPATQGGGATLQLALANAAGLAMQPAKVSAILRLY